ncbi:MAG: hypothetical protein A3C43_05680 [Candidatus Schekmanbacteria bacterium RIFCSPHIGHO2_02_FULL_38_11]|uniref:Glycosyltransferase n=1 Tax=Candidatus Schekmanbacteria bacterium RIFCSPLOWO2_12_FULL_38_15 TaxID=1817883 RepID=A0A1F7SFN3_9BACT|nr:MAG: hypothetical protein A2043_11520 [Candidatus Schekmanbacteria bacterium GWA2_38_9]OGL49391.1 MAG: hypothetical protein A3H37_06855 [Candidatus Schekmanbacteria bacterium RIFCSPLOWO2_02_FULL_38_14]OGL52616.1 MAG: hypothetical protein A3G31_11675 [Candidatus Schekmanbacteria bacterium RIFCSPLOWO2_12_FULL_38_15]OGL55521.1 MAG: hypothetical protein A3C43_05680 [Candidatus Schekmanbacteria bacterium RIFCSPHIGHO2_02_FULL_38_11]
MEESLSLIQGSIENKTPSTLFHLSVDCVCIASSDKELDGIYRKSTLVLPDGMLLVWTSRLLGTPLKEKISGPDLLPKICEMSAKKDYRIFLLGGREGVAEKAARVLQNRYKGLKIAGYSHGYFNKEGAENSRVIETIRDKKPDILVVAFGTPLQEKWIFNNLDSFNLPLCCIGVGAAIDFISGNIQRAPEWMQKNGLEWLFRLVSEPGRLWKRYLVKDMKFFYLILRHIIDKKKIYL